MWAESMSYNMSMLWLIVMDYPNLFCKKKKKKKNRGTAFVK